ncbi:hypothetical protein Tco_0210397 [Tanacetum coccineum]
MAKKDMDVYTSMLNQTDLNDVVIKYNIPRDLHPRLPPPGFVMPELPYDAIGIYHHLKPPTDSYSQADVWRLSARIVKLGDMPKGVLVMFGLSRVWKSLTRDPILRDSNGNDTGGVLFSLVPTLQRYPFYCTPAAAADVAIPNPTLKDLAASNPDAKYWLRMKLPRSERPLFLVQLQTMLQSALERTRADVLTPPLLKVLETEILIGNLTGDAIHKDFFPFTPGPYYATYLEDGIIAGSYETVVDQFPTPGEMVQIEALIDD